MVIFGIIGESAELIVKWGKKESFRKCFGDRLNPILLDGFVKFIRPKILPVETVFIGMVVFGLAIEFLGTHKANGILFRNNSDLLATNTAISSQVAGLNKEAADERLKADQLEMQMMPRRIYFNERMKFMDLTKGVNKFPIKIVVGQTDNETENFARDVSDFFESAGFHQNQGVIHVPNSFVRIGVPAGTGYITHQMVAVYCSTNGESHGTRGFLIGTNGMMDGFINDPKEPYSQFFDFVNNLGESGIDADVMDGRTFLIDGKPIFQPGEFGIYVPQKVY
jgi:hypothetical protein